MEDGTTLLFDLPGFRVVECYEDEDGQRQVVVMGLAAEHACPGCGVLVAKPYDHREMALKDLPFGHRPLRLRWRKRRYACSESACPRRTFTETSTEVPPRHRLTGRLRAKLESAASGSARALSDVAAEYGVSWWSVQHALVVTAAGLLPDPTPVRVLGLDETRARSVRWLFGATGWRRSEPWMTSFVDLDLGRPGGLLGLTPGRSGAAVEGWLSQQSAEWRAGIEVVALDPSAPFASAIRRALPRATIVVDHWHLVRLANQVVTEVRQRVAREQLGRRGRRVDPAWAHRRLLLRAGDQLSAAGLRRLAAVLTTDDPSNEIGAAWGVKELLRGLLAARTRHDAAGRLYRFYDACLAADMAETTRLAETIATWWPHIEPFLRTGITNARTEGYNRVIKQVKRVGCGYRNQANYERRIVLHIAARRAA
jgi:transposase